MAKIKTNPEAMNIRLNNAEEWISQLEDRIVEITHSEQETEDKWGKKKKKERKPHTRSMGNIKYAMEFLLWCSTKESE